MLRERSYNFTLLSFLSDELSFCPTLYLAGAMWQVLEGELLVIK